MRAAAAFIAALTLATLAAAQFRGIVDATWFLQSVSTNPEPGVNNGWPSVLSAQLGAIGGPNGTGQVWTGNNLASENKVANPGGLTGFGKNINNGPFRRLTGTVTNGVMALVVQQSVLISTDQGIAYYTTWNNGTTLTYPSVVAQPLLVTPTTSSDAKVAYGPTYTGSYNTTTGTYYTSIRQDANVKCLITEYMIVVPGTTTGSGAMYKYDYDGIVANQSTFGTTTLKQTIAAPAGSSRFGSAITYRSGVVAVGDATGNIVYIYQGNISLTNNQAVVQAGCVWSYVLTQTITRTDTSQFGFSLHFTQGSGVFRLIVGAPGDAPTSRTSKVVIYTFNGTVANFTTEVTAPNSVTGAQFGYSVHAWGGVYAAVGAPGYNGGRGAAYFIAQTSVNGTAWAIDTWLNSTQTARGYGSQVRRNDCRVIWVAAPGTGADGTLSTFYADIPILTSTYCSCTVENVVKQYPRFERTISGSPACSLQNSTSRYVCDLSLATSICALQPATGLKFTAPRRLAPNSTTLYVCEPNSGVVTKFSETLCMPQYK